MCRTPRRPAGRGGGGGDADSSPRPSYAPGVATTRSRCAVDPPLCSTARGARSRRRRRGAQEEADAVGAVSRLEAGGGGAARAARRRRTRQRLAPHERARRRMPRRRSTATGRRRAGRRRGEASGRRRPRQASDTEADAETDAPPRTLTKDFERARPEPRTRALAHGLPRATRGAPTRACSFSRKPAPATRRRRRARRVACEARGEGGRARRGIPKRRTRRPATPRVGARPSGCAPIPPRRAPRRERRGWRVARPIRPRCAPKRRRRRRRERVRRRGRRAPSVSPPRAPCAPGRARAPPDRALESLLVECARTARLGAGGLVALRGPRCSPRRAAVVGVPRPRRSRARLARLKQRRGSTTRARRGRWRRRRRHGRARAACCASGLRRATAGRRSAGRDASDGSERVRAHALATATSWRRRRGGQSARSPRASARRRRSVGASGASRALRGRLRRRGYRPPSQRRRRPRRRLRARRSRRRAPSRSDFSVARRGARRLRARGHPRVAAARGAPRAQPGGGTRRARARAAALELFSTTTLRALLDDGVDAQSRVRFRVVVFLRLEAAFAELEKNAVKKNASAFPASCAACLGASHRASAALAAAGDATRRAEVAASLALAADAVPAPPRAPRRRAPARSAASGETFGVSGDADAVRSRAASSRRGAERRFCTTRGIVWTTTGTRDAAATPARRSRFSARRTSPSNAPARDVRLDARFRGDPRVFPRAFHACLGFELGEDADAEAEEEPDVPDAAAKESRAPSAGSVLAQWRAPIAPPVSVPRGPPHEKRESVDARAHRRDDEDDA